MPNIRQTTSLPTSAQPLKTPTRTTPVDPEKYSDERDTLKKLIEMNA